MKISLIHPSRSRAKKAKETYNYWLSRANKKYDIEHILSLDADDFQLQEYRQLFENSTIIISNNNCVVEATNIAAKVSKGDVLIYLSDDFKCPKNWDDSIKSVMGSNEPILIKVDDCLQNFDVAVLTIPIMNRKLYETLNYFWFPLYKSMFVDEDLFWTCKNNSWILNCSELKFKHEHHSVGLAKNDETYKKSEANWNQGKELFAKRKSENFPLCY